jgi:hypothetical protein
LTTLREWPDGSRIEIPGRRHTLYYRDDGDTGLCADVAADATRHWFTGRDCAGLTWADLLDIHGEDDLAAARPLYQPTEQRPPAYRPVTVLLGGTVEAPTAWVFTDTDDAHAARADGAGTVLLPTVVFGVGVLPTRHTIFTGWARVGRDFHDDCAPQIVQTETHHIRPDTSPWLQCSGDDQDTIAVLGHDVLDLYAAGPSAADVINNLDLRMALLIDARMSPPTPIGAHAAQM